MSTARTKPPPFAAPVSLTPTVAPPAVVTDAADAEVREFLRRLGPGAPDFVRLLGAHFADETARREAFREDHGVKFPHGEFIDGEVVLPSPMRFRHRRVMTRFAGLGEAFVRRNPIGIFETGGLLVRTPRNDFEPDVYFWPKAISDAFTPEQTIFPAPTFVAEVLSPSTEERDRGVKFEDYAAHGVLEYWIIDPEAETVECFDLRDGRYALREKVSVASGATLRCAAIAGLAFPVAALFGDLANREAVERLRAGT